MIMIEFEGITGNVKSWIKDVIYQITSNLPQDKIMFEAADPKVFSYYIENLGTHTNLNDYDDDYDENEELEDCQYDIDFKTFKKSEKLQLCDSLEKPSLKSRIQLKVYINHSEEIIHIRALSFSLTNNSLNKSLIQLTTDIIEDFKYPTSLLFIDQFQFIYLSTLKSILLSLINVNFNLLKNNLKKSLIISKGGHKQLLFCEGNFYPKQNIQLLNIRSDITKPITCNKQAQHDRFFTLQEKLYLNKEDQNKFRLYYIHQDNENKINRISWYTCNNPKSCTYGIQNKSMLDKTVNYVLKFLEKSRTEKNPSSG
ncbi:unnamed protein product [Rotaria sordida]|uniref:Uncharacterized protein n=1 Tax=Rotaria sordida TaxID=392033 RepID=A0A815HKG0_9BILA|nr:unnamed protein product [Rotaria sordida]